MKKGIVIIALLCAVLAPMQAVCQGAEQTPIVPEVTYVKKPFYDTSRTDKLLHIIGHASVGFSSLQLNYGKVVEGITDFLLSPGIQIKFGVDVSFRLRNSLSLTTGLAFGINNSRYAMSMVDNRTGSISSLFVRNHFYDLTVPVYMSWNLNLAHQVKWLIDGGFYVAYGVGGHLKASGYNSGENSIGQPIVTHASFQTDYFNSSTSLINGVKPFDYGPRIGTGIAYKDMIIVKIIGQLSACNLAKNHGVISAKYRNVSLEFQLGYCF